MSDGRNARGRIYQDSTFTVPDVVGRVIEQLLGIVYTPGTSPCCFLLAVRGLPWQRFFFDAGLVFWGEYDEEELEEDLASPLVDYGREHSLAGRAIEHAGCGEREDFPQTLCLTIALDDGRSFVAYMVDAMDLDSPIDVAITERAGVT